MAQYVSGFVGLSQTNSQIAALKADFSGMIKLDSIVDKVLNRLALNARTQHYVAQVKSGQLRQGEFDYWFADEVRRELGKVLGIVRAKAVAKARAAGAGSAGRTKAKQCPSRSGERHPPLLRSGHLRRLR